MLEQVLGTRKLVTGGHCLLCQLFPTTYSPHTHTHISRSQKSGNGWSKRTKESGELLPSTNCGTCSAPQSRTCGCRHAGEAADVAQGVGVCVWGVLEAWAWGGAPLWCPLPASARPSWPLTPLPGGLRPTGWTCSKQWPPSAPTAPTAVQRPPSAARDARTSGTAAGEGASDPEPGALSPTTCPQALQASLPTYLQGMPSQALGEAWEGVCQGSPGWQCQVKKD